MDNAQAHATLLARYDGDEALLAATLTGALAEDDADEIVQGRRAIAALAAIAAELGCTAGDTAKQAGELMVLALAVGGAWMEWNAAPIDSDAEAQWSETVLDRAEDLARWLFAPATSPEDGALAAQIMRRTYNQVVREMGGTVFMDEADAPATEPRGGEGVG